MIQTMYGMKVVAAKGCFRDILRSFHSLSQRLMLTFLKKAKIPFLTFFRPYNAFMPFFFRTFGPEIIKGEWKGSGKGVEREW